MNLDVNICSVCGRKNFADSEYVSPMNMCNTCFAQQQVNMMNIRTESKNEIRELKKKLQSISDNNDSLKSDVKKEYLIANENINFMQIYKYHAVIIKGGIFQADLMWEVHQGNDYFWGSLEEAKKYARKLNKKNYCNHNDWRIPSENELKKLLTSSQNNGYYIVDVLSDNLHDTGYGNGCYHCSTQIKDKYGWLRNGMINFKDGSINAHKDGAYSVRCVRNL